MTDPPARPGWAVPNWARYGKLLKGPFLNLLHRLMRPLVVVMLDIFGSNMIKMLLGEDDEFVEALLLDRLHEKGLNGEVSLSHRAIVPQGCSIAISRSCWTNTSKTWPMA